MLLRPKVVEMTPVDKIQLKSGKTKPATSGHIQPKSGTDQHGGFEGGRGYRFVNIKSAVELGAQAVLDHQRKHPECDGQQKLLAEEEERRGLPVSEMMSCQKCGYKTEKTKMYSEIPHKGQRRGRRTATPNMAFQVGLQNTGIAASGARRLLTSMDTAVPSSSGLQKIENKCGQIIRDENMFTTKDTELLKRLLQKRIGPEAMERTKYGTSTQKAESMNHAYAMTNPKGTLTFSSNAAARDHSAIHIVNNKHANSIVKKCEAAGCPISAGSPAASALVYIDK